MLAVAGCYSLKPTFANVFILWTCCPLSRTSSPSKRDKGYTPCSVPSACAALISLEVLCLEKDISDRRHRSGLSAQHNAVRDCRQQALIGRLLLRVTVQIIARYVGYDWSFDATGSNVQEGSKLPSLLLLLSGTL